MDFSIDPQTQELLEQIQDLVERELYPLETDLETNGIRSLLPRLSEVRERSESWASGVPTSPGNRAAWASAWCSTPW